MSGADGGAGRGGPALPDAGGAQLARPDAPSRGADPNLFTLLSVPLRHRALVLGMGLLVATAAVLLGGLLRRRAYEAEASFVLESARAAANLSGLAAQLGVNVPGGAAGQTPDFYLELLRSREIVGALVDSTYEVRRDTGVVRGTLVAIYDPDEETAALRRDAAMERLVKAITPTLSAKTGVVRFKIRAESASLAHQLVTRALRELDRYNQQRRQSQAAAERRFTEARLAEVRTELRTAESRMQSFLQANREFQNAPVLTFEADRLRRDLGLQQQLYTTLAASYEQAKIDEVRDTPLITLVERPELPSRPAPRGLLTKALLGFVGGALVGVFVAFWREYVSVSGERRDAAFAEYSTLRSATMDDLKRPWRPVRRLLRPGA